MLKKIALRNARRQLSKYSLFVLTMIICVSLMYAYNSLIFSDNVLALMSAALKSGAGALVFIISVITALIILILGWFVSYMLMFMLRKRSEELAIYMFLGIEKKQITKLFVTENSVIGIGALILGEFLGVFVSEILEIIITRMLSGTYYRTISLSIPAAVLTVVDFLLIYMVALPLCNKKLKKSELIDLIYYDQTVQYSKKKRPAIGFMIFLLSITAGILSFYLFVFHPIGQGIDILIGIILIILCLLGLFKGIVPSVLLFFDKNVEWKYSSSHMFVLKEFITKINHRSMLLGILSILMTFSIVLLGLGVSTTFLIKEATKLEAFDVVILHLDEKYNFDEYKDYLNKNGYKYRSHNYTLYQNGEKNLQIIRNATLNNHLKNMDDILKAENYIFSENKFDMYIGYTDYNALRKVMGLESIKMDSKSFMIHCMSYLESEFRDYMNIDGALTINSSVLQCAGIKTEPLNQYNGYGNGQEYLVVVPDAMLTNLEVGYSLFVANFNEGIIDSRIVDKFDNLQILSRENSYVLDDGYPTIIPRGLREYNLISGKTITLSGGPEVTSTIPVMYLSFILLIIGIVIIAIQILHENRDQRNRYNMLNVLGMDYSQIKKVLRHCTLIYFILPLVPTLLIGGGLVYYIALSVCSQYFYVPVLNDDNLLAIMTLGIVCITIIIIYAMYALLSYSLLKRTLISSEVGGYFDSK